MQQDTVPNVSNTIIESSHLRSQNYGLDPCSHVDYGPLDRYELSRLIEQNRLLHTHAVPAMETLYQQIGRASCRERV